MIEKLFNNPRILHQTPDSEDDMPEQPIAAFTDCTGLICISQEGRAIVMSRKGVYELIGMLAGLLEDSKSEEVEITHSADAHESGETG